MDLLIFVYTTGSLVLDAVCFQIKLPGRTDLVYIDKFLQGVQNGNHTWPRHRVNPDHPVHLVVTPDYHIEIVAHIRSREVILGTGGYICLLVCMDLLYASGTA